MSDTPTPERLRTLLAEASKPNPFEWHFPWRVIPCDGKPIIAGAKSGNLFRGYIATWQEANLAVGAVNALPELLATIERLSAALEEARQYIHETITTRARREVMLAKIDTALGKE